MSKPSNDLNVVPAAPSTEETVATPEEKRPNVIVRGFHKIKHNPKPALAVAGGTALIFVAAALGRATAPSTQYDVFIQEDDEYVPLDVMEVTDTVTD